MQIPFEQDDDGRVVYDFDAAQAARDEVEPSRFLRIGGKEVPLPTALDIPIDAAELIANGQPDLLVMRMFGEEWGPHVIKHMSVGHLEAITKIVVGVGQEDNALGESQASTV